MFSHVPTINILSETKKKNEIFQLKFSFSKPKNLCKMYDLFAIEPPHEKTNNLHRRKQRRRSASR